MKFITLILLAMSLDCVAMLRVVIPTATELNDFELKVGELVLSDDLQKVSIQTSTMSVPLTNPSGVVLAFGGTTAPVGYLLCDGSTVSRTTYADLYAAVGDAFGAGNGTTTFHLPDFRGRFLRGVDGEADRDLDKAGRDPMAAGGSSGNNVGSVQADEIKQHTHSYGTAYANTANGAYWPNMPYGGAGTGINVGSTGGSETRPKNANVNFIIKI